MLLCFTEIYVEPISFKLTVATGCDKKFDVLLKSNVEVMVSWNFRSYVKWWYVKQLSDEINSSIKDVPEMWQLQPSSFLGRVKGGDHLFPNLGDGWRAVWTEWAMVTM